MREAAAAAAAEEALSPSGGDGQRCLMVEVERGLTLGRVIDLRGFWLSAVAFKNMAAGRQELRRSKDEIELSGHVTQGKWESGDLVCDLMDSSFCAIGLLLV